MKLSSRSCALSSGSGSRLVGSAQQRRVAPSRSLQLRVAAVADVKPATKGSSGSMSAIKADVDAKLRYQLGRSKKDGYTPPEVYLGVANSVRERLVDSFEDTHDYWE
jgi:hypothetical protein